MVVLSFFAGICEEVVYRGFFFWFLSGHLPMIPAIILTNIPFALAHLSTTGVKNTLGAFMLGLIFTGALLLTGSLWLPILLHIVADLLAAIQSYKVSKILSGHSGL